MIRFSTTIFQFGEQGEKTGWHYISITAAQAGQLGHQTKKSFRVKGKLDEFAIKEIALMPMGDGSFIMPLNATIRKGIKKRKGATLLVQIEKDETVFVLSNELMECLSDEPKALEYFNTLPKSHQRYFSNWINAAKTEPTKAKRIAQAVTGLSRKMNFGEMIRSLKTI
ncbi:hypothetical protein GALL_55280 [mine drainage metagenome]|uniref:DUF1905 domain-containing protein n=1 Tax=mine drainage metagenome TaxID=410659 RepID=A0A1J5TA66_9ZZZZ